MYALNYLGSVFGSGLQPNTQRQADARFGVMGLTAGVGMTAMMVSSVAFPPLGLALAGASFGSGVAALSYALETEERNYDKNIANKKIVVGFAEGTTSGLVPFSNPILNSGVQSAARSVVGNVLPEVIDNKPLTVKKVGESMVEAAVDGAIGAITTTVFYGVREAYVGPKFDRMDQGDMHLIYTAGCIAASTVASAANNSMNQLKQGKNFEFSQVFDAAMFGGFFGCLLARIEIALDSDIQLNKEEITSINLRLKWLEDRARLLEDSLPQLEFASVHITQGGRDIKGLTSALSWAAGNGNYIVSNPYGEGYYYGNGTPVRGNIDLIKGWVTGNHGKSHGIVLKNCSCSPQYLYIDGRFIDENLPQYIYIDGGLIDKAYRELNMIAEETKELLYSFPADLQDRIWNAVYPQVSTSQILTNEAIFL